MKDRNAWGKLQLPKSDQTWSGLFLYMVVPVKPKEMWNDWDRGLKRLDRDPVSSRRPWKMKSVSRKLFLTVRELWNCLGVSLLFQALSKTICHKIIQHHIWLLPSLLHQDIQHHRVQTVSLYPSHLHQNAVVQRVQTQTPLCGLNL